MFDFYNNDDLSIDIAIFKSHVGLDTSGHMPESSIDIRQTAFVSKRIQNDFVLHLQLEVLE